MSIKEQAMKFNTDKHVETLDNDYGNRSKHPQYDLYNQENEYEIPEEFKHFTNKVDKNDVSHNDEYGGEYSFSST